MTIMYDSSGIGVGADNPLPIQSIQKKLRDSFTTPQLDTKKWTVVKQGANQTMSQAGGVLSINTGTTINAETIIESNDYYSVPLRLMYGMFMSQRIANQEVLVELISIDGKTMATHEYNQAHVVAWKYDGVIATSAKYEVTNSGLPRLSASTSVLTSASYSIKEIEMFTDESWFHDRAIDSIAGRSASWVRHQQIPDPNLLYKIRIIVRNLGTAPASNTVVNFQYVTIIDYVELTTEITASRGATAAGMSMPVNVSGGTLATVGIASVKQSATWKVETVTNLGASAVYTGTAVACGSATVLNSSKIRVRVYSSHAGTLRIEQSRDSTVGNYRAPVDHIFPIAAGECRQFEVDAMAFYYRVVFTNGATATTGLEILSTLVGV